MIRRCFLMALALVMAAALLAGCGPSTAATATLQSAPVEPPKSVSGDSLTIAVPIRKDEYYELYRDHMTRLQGLLSDAGWNITLSPLGYTVPDGQSDEDAILYAIRTQTAGAPDAWHTPAAIAKRLRAEGLTRDMAGVLPKAAPMLWGACKAAFDGAVDGAPMSLSTAAKEGPVALLMSTARLAAYGQPIASAEDVMTYLEKTSDAVISDNGFDDALLTDAWAAQQGYYALTDYGLRGYLYAHRDDPNCKIVPVEDIPGFADYYLRSTGLLLQERLRAGTDDRSSKEAGMLVRLHKGADPGLQARTGLMGKDITALPLVGCDPASAADTPSVYLMLAVAAGSDRADAVATLAQWALLDPKGYEACTLGQPDKDYRFVGDRVEYLNAGAPLAPADWDITLKSPAFHNLETFFVYNGDMKPSTIYEAANVDRVLAGYHTVTPPIWKAKSLRTNWYQLFEMFSVTRRAYEDVLSQRYSDLGFMVARINNVPEFTPEHVLQRLRDNRPKLDPFLAELNMKIADMLANPD